MHFAKPYPRRPSSWLLLLLTFLLPVATYGQTMTLDEVADRLFDACEEAAGAIATSPPAAEEEWFSPKCRKADSGAVDVAACRANLEELWKARFEKDREEAANLLSISRLSIVRDASQTPTLASSLSRVLREARREVRRTLAREIAAIDLSSFEPGDDPTAKARSTWTGVAEALKSDGERTCVLVAEGGLEVIESNLLEQRIATEVGAAAAHALAEGEKDLLDELSGLDTDGFSRVVRCKWVAGTDTKPPVLTCPGGLRLGGEEASAVQFVDLPPGAVVTVVSAEEVVPHESLARAECRRVKRGCRGFVFREPLPQLRCPGETAIETRKRSDHACDRGDHPCEHDHHGHYRHDHRGWVAPADRLSCDQVCVPGNSTLLAVHTPRWFGPTYGGAFADTDYARRTLRRPGRSTLSIVLHGKTPFILVQVSHGARRASSAIPVAYQRWTFETGGFFAVSNLTDAELVTRPMPAAEGDAASVEIVRVANEDDQGQETGVFLNFVPRNYQVVGVGLGFAVESDRAPTTYLGPTIRLRSFGERGLAALWGGIVLREAQRFPGVEAGDVLPANDPLIQGETRFEEDWFLGVQLGFSFGPVQSGD